MISAGEFRNGVTFELEGNVFQIVELTVKCGSGQGYSVFVFYKLIEAFRNSNFCVMRAYPDTLTAINTALFSNCRFTIFNANRFGGATLNASNATLTTIRI